MGHHLAGAVIDRDHGRRQAPSERGRVLAGELLEVGLGGGIDSEAMHQAALGLLDRGVRQVRGQHGELAARARHALAHGAARLVGGNDALGSGVRQHAVARAQRGLREAVGPAQLRRLRQGDQQGCLRQ